MNTTAIKYLPNPSSAAWFQPDQRLEPHIEELLDYAQFIDSQGKHLDYQQAVLNIKESMLRWVNVGLVAFQVKAKRLYQKFYLTFKEFCENELGVTHWRINNYIKAARVVIELAQAGFKILPTCEAQCQPLVKFFGDELIEKWQEVIDSIPSHLITKNTIEDILGMDISRKSNIKVNKQLADKLKQKAIDRGISLEELLEDFLSEDERLEDVPIEKTEQWEQDLDQLVEENKHMDTFGTLKENTPFNHIFPDGKVPIKSMTPMRPRDENAPLCYLVDSKYLDSDQILQLAESLSKLWTADRLSVDDAINYIIKGLPLNCDWFESVETSDIGVYYQLIT
jgi:hypothetical protein